SHGSRRREPCSEVGAHTDEEKRPEYDRVRNWLPHVLLHPPGEVDHAEEGRDIREAVESLPARMTQPFERPARRRGGQWNEQDEGRKADEDELALRDVVPDGPPVQNLIEAHIGSHVQESVGETEQPEHPAKPDRPRPAEKYLEWRAGERCD